MSAVTVMRSARRIITTESIATSRRGCVRTETAAAVRRAVAALPDDLRAPVLLSSVEELSHAEIAQILEISPKAVERHLSRARDLLRTRLQPYL